MRARNKKLPTPNCAEIIIQRGAKYYKENRIKM